MDKWRCYIEDCIRNIGSSAAKVISYTIERTCFHKDTDCPRIKKFTNKFIQKDKDE